MKKQHSVGKSLSTILSGVSGEYFVAAELSRRGYTAALTLKNTRGLDILASSSDGKRSVTIQVKTTQGSGADWFLGRSDETSLGPNHFYVFVALNGLGAPKYYIVPAPEVATSCRERHRAWLEGRKRDGSPRKDTSIRGYKPNEEFLGDWGSLGLDA